MIEFLVGKCCMCVVDWSRGLLIFVWVWGCFVGDDYVWENWLYLDEICLYFVLVRICMFLRVYFECLYYEYLGWVVLWGNCEGNIVCVWGIIFKLSC